MITNRQMELFSCSTNRRVRNNYLRIETSGIVRCTICSTKKDDSLYIPYSFTKSISELVNSNAEQYLFNYFYASQYPTSIYTVSTIYQLFKYSFNIYECSKLIKVKCANNNRIYNIGKGVLFDKDFNLLYLMADCITSDTSYSVFLISEKLFLDDELRSFVTNKMIPAYIKLGLKMEFINSSYIKSYSNEEPFNSNDDSTKFKLEHLDRINDTIRSFYNSHNLSSEHSLLFVENE